METIIKDVAVVINWIFSNLFYINIFLAIIIVFFQRRDPQSVWTWLLVLYFLPVVGFILYLIIGQDYRKSKMFRIKGVEDALSWEAEKQKEKLKNHKLKMSDKPLGVYSDLILYNLKTCGAIYTEGNKIDIFTEGERKFNSLFESMEKAKSSIHIQYYIMRDDPLFRRLEDIIIRKADEGVEVRILYDAIGGKGIKRKTLKNLRSHGIKTGIFFKAFFKKINFRINYRNHRKIVVIDGRVGYVGGFNFGVEYLGEKKRYGNWRDTHLRIEGPAVDDLQTRFMLDWNYAVKENLFKDGKYFYDYSKKNPDKKGIQIISSGPDSSWQVIKDNYVKLISKAEKTIRIQTPYFIPDNEVRGALSIAALSGVDVKLMIPCKPDHPFVYWATYSNIGSLLASGARCFVYDNGFLHAKGITVDGLVSSYGTTNMDIRSFALNFEVNAVIYNSETTKKFDKIFEEDLKYCREITLEDYKKRSLIIRFKEQFSRLLSPLM